MELDRLRDVCMHRLADSLCSPVRDLLQAMLTTAHPFQLGDIHDEQEVPQSVRPGLG